MTAVTPINIRSYAARAPVKVLVVDDSVVMRSIIERMFESRSDIQIVSKVATAKAALEFLAKERADIILLDHEMPQQKGLEALPAILEAGKGARVVMLSSYCKQGGETAVKALALGASDIIAKPESGNATPDFPEALAERLRRLVRSGPCRPAKDSHYTYRVFPKRFRLQCIAIGASTGGIHALRELLGGYKGKLGVPILVTQHLPESFTPYYVEQVARMSDMPAYVARSGQILEPDIVYIAPGDKSLTCQRHGKHVRISLKAERDLMTGALPSVNLMFASLAECYDAGTLGIVLTGIGRDGTSGADAIVKSDGIILAQDQASSVVWGMPGSVTRSELVCSTLPPETMLDYIQRELGARP